MEVNEGMESVEIENTENVNDDHSTEEFHGSTENTESSFDGEVQVEGDKEVTEYSPDYSFKVRNESLEFDEKLKPFVTSKEVEEHLRELHTKAHGLDYLKKGLDEKTSKLAELESSKYEIEREFNQLHEGFQKLGEMSKNDFTSFQKTLHISDDAILDRAAEILEYREADTSRQQEMDRRYQERMESYSKEDQMTALQRQNAMLHKNQHQIAFTQAMSSSDVTSFKEQFDRKMGEGAFESKVKEYGSFVYNTQKKYISPSEAISGIMAQYKPFFAEQASQQAEINPTKTNTKAPNPIPNLGTGKTVSPTKRRFKSLDEMRKYGEELERQELMSQYR